MKNIVICCDGTANQLGEENSNVVKLYSILKRRNEEQITYYDPGVGTLSEPGINSSFVKKLSIGLGLAFGNGLKKNVVQAYTFLMNNYQAGDRAFFFGFSRGAYTVRVVTALIRMCGLLEKGGDNLIPYAYRIFAKKDFELAKKYKATYSQPCKIHFVGVWDTVSSYGFIGDWKNFPYTATNEEIEIVRHAISIDERRTFYRQNLFKEISDQNIKQVWFAGVHSDVGGSYPEKESGSSKITLNWMVTEAFEYGLKLNIDGYNEVVLGQSNEFSSPDHNATLNISLKSFWWMAELLPRKLYNPVKKRKTMKIPLGQRRYIANDSVIHESVADRMKGSSYDPKNLPKDFQVEPVAYI